jgi:hypothetical protein
LKRATWELHPEATPAITRTAAPRDKMRPLRRKTLNCMAPTRTYSKHNWHD